LFLTPLLALDAPSTARSLAADVVSCGWLWFVRRRRPAYLAGKGLGKWRRRVNREKEVGAGRSGTFYIRALMCRGGFDMLGEGGILRILSFKMLEDVVWLRIFVCRGPLNAEDPEDASMP